MLKINLKNSLYQSFRKPYFYQPIIMLKIVFQRIVSLTTNVPYSLSTVLKFKIFSGFKQILYSQQSVKRYFICFWLVTQLNQVTNNEVHKIDSLLEVLNNLQAKHYILLCVFG